MKTWIDDESNPGSYYCVWNGTDDQNQSFANGIYFYRMISDAFQDTRWMIYL